MAIDLNSDMGEGFGAWRMGDDEALLDVVTSANVACGFHAGDPVTMRRVCEGAAVREVSVGAHVGYRDLAGFGRRRMDVSARELTDDVIYQLGALSACARAAGTRVRYVKPHGALFHDAARDPECADAVAAAVAACEPQLALLGLPGTALADATAAAGLTFVIEAYADRRYTASGGLVARREPGAVIDDPDAVTEQAIGLARDGRVRAQDGSEVEVAARSLCVHGDTPGAVTLACAVRDALVAAGVTLAAFV